jgi:hypothetical protein
MKAQILLLFAIRPLFSCGQDTQSSQTAATTEARQPLSAEYMRKAIGFIRQVKGRELADSKFILADNAISVNSNKCLQYALADNKFYSPVEVKLIESRAASWQHQWKKTDFPTVNFVKQDTVTAIFKNFSKNWEYFHKHIGRDFNEFSLPVFIRNDTYCLFYSANYCGGLCGGGSLVLYKKQKGVWIAVKSYCDWIS